MEWGKERMDKKDGDGVAANKIWYKPFVSK